MKHQPEIEQLNSHARAYCKKLNDALNEIKRVIVGQEEILNKLMICLVADGHVLLEGVPGLAKTLMVKTLSDTLAARFCRIQFTPDLLPADIIGTKIYDHRTASFTTQKGPIFSNFILADEINRSPPKVQSALLEAMQERQVSIQGETFGLDSPFLVLATQNPIETEGTYKLPEAQVDRFTFKLLIEYPKREEEKAIIQRNTQGIAIRPTKVLTTRDIIEIQRFNQKIYADEMIEDYVTELVDATRYPENYKLGGDIKGLVEYGASPRASIWLILTGKAHALLNARGYVIPEDIKAVAHDVLRHRIILTYEAEAEGITADDIIDKIMANIRAP
ncbi:MAG: AAA family ATPase [Methanophagales archaeon]|nr:AAA family ATPase [Methanophagales archaeon]MCW3141579.1 AAA family ATPase [Methanophagales archaeon]